MDQERFDELARALRPNSTATGRRRLFSAFAAIMAGILLPSARIEGAAARRNPAGAVQRRKAQRRKQQRNTLNKRRHEQRQDRKDRRKAQDPDNFGRGISLLLRNPNTARTTIHVETGELSDLTGTCDLLAVFDIVPGQQRLFDTSAKNVYAWAANRYWFHFQNPLVDLPGFSASVGGNGEGYNCHPGGTEVLDFVSMREGRTVSPTLEGHTFVIERQDDKPDFKFFIVTLAPDL